MTRRDVLTVAELVAVCIALAAGTSVLTAAASLPGHTRWTLPAAAAGMAALVLLLPTTLALLLCAAWRGAPGAVRAVRARVQEWRQWRGIQRVAEPPRRSTRDTMAVRPRAHAATRRHVAGGAR